MMVDRRRSSRDETGVDLHRFESGWSLSEAFSKQSVIKQILNSVTEHQIECMHVFFDMSGQVRIPHRSLASHPHVMTGEQRTAVFCVGLLAGCHS